MEDKHQAKKNEKVLVTGSAGFIGFHLVNRLAEEGYEVIGLDNINDYYDPELKFARLREAGIAKEDVAWGRFARSSKYPNYRFIRMDLQDTENIESLFAEERFDIVVNLAAQAGVRYSLENPRAYIDSNVMGFLNILEGCRHNGIKHLVYASSSSVYGLNEKMPLSVKDNVDHPVSLYAATKKSNELMAHTYSHLYGLPTTGLRFFTVYGPWGRPDMALFLFTEAMLKGDPIKVFNHGDMIRDFTYIDDIVEGVFRILNSPAKPDPNWSGAKTGSSMAPYRLYNIGNHNPVKLLDFIKAIEECLGIEAEKEMLPLQMGDVRMTFADTSGLVNNFAYQPQTSIEEGVLRFMKWYKKMNLLAIT